jgi:hypothetical protein
MVVFVELPALSVAVTVNLAFVIFFDVSRSSSPGSTRPSPSTSGFCGSIRAILAHYRLALAYEGKKRPDRTRQSYEAFLGLWAGADRDVPEIVSAQRKFAALH